VALEVQRGREQGTLARHGDALQHGVSAGFRGRRVILGRFWGGVSGKQQGQRRKSLALLPFWNAPRRTRTYNPLIKRRRGPCENNAVKSSEVPVSKQFTTPALQGQQGAIFHSISLLLPLFSPPAG
jgi:hypothetical protein